MSNKGGIPGNATISPSMINSCLVCKTKLIPIVHRLDPDILDLQDKGLALASLDKTYNSFCPLCEESYRDFTLPPAISEDMQNSLEQEISEEQSL